MNEEIRFSQPTLSLSNHFLRDTKSLLCFLSGVVWVLWFEVWGLGFGVSVWGLGFGVRGCTLEGGGTRVGARGTGSGSPKSIC